MTAPLPTHGVLIELENTGIYLIGNSHVGKTETALQLIHQGAILICDDAPELIPSPDNRQLLGRCPEGFEGLMHLRDLGIINIIELLGKQSFKANHTIDFVIELVNPRITESGKTDHDATVLAPDYHHWQYQQWTIPGISLHLYPDRNLPLLINTAIKQFKNTKKTRETQQ